MKKSLVALAVLAASGASFAQSSVTVYGIVDMWVGSLDNGTTSTTLLNSGGVSANRWGLKGSEDLGGGLKANFNLEQGFNSDTGAAATANSAFSRQSWVGFSGGFGEVRVGRTTTPFDDVSGVANALFDSDLSPMYGVGAPNGVFASATYVARPNNTIFYQAPDFGGFSGAISYSLDESVAAAPNVTSMNLTYAAGPVAVQLGYQTEDIVNTVGLPDDYSVVRLGGSYDFGTFKLMANYGQATSIGNQSGFDATDYQIGADIPVGSALVVSVSYAKSDDSNPAAFAAAEQSREGYGIAAAYNLSKRTFLYGGYQAATTSQAGVADVDSSLFAVGINHRF
ncbi:MAG: porin [Patescibacteria group bacterium]